MKYLFGPVNSRRLGISQGIDLLPAKICNFNCIYCEIGQTTVATCTRQEYTPTQDIISEINLLLTDRKAIDRLDIFTITASGEPTLHSGIGTIIRHIKNNTDKPVAVITNSSLLAQQEVRQELMAADIIIPSLDAALSASYIKVNRPINCAQQLAPIIDGIIKLSQEFAGEIWLEILLTKKINDTPQDIVALREAVQAINPDRIQLNTVARPPLEAFAEPLSQASLTAIKNQFNQHVEIVVDYTVNNQTEPQTCSKQTNLVKTKTHENHLTTTGKANDSHITTEILNVLKRRPCTSFDISCALNLKAETTAAHLQQMISNNKLTKTRHHDKEYYQINTKCNKKKPNGSKN